MDVNRERPCDFRRNQIIQGKTHRSEGALLGMLPYYKLVIWHDISSQAMQDINVAMGVDEILTEVLTIKRYTKCQFVRIQSNMATSTYFHFFSGQNIGPSHGTGAFRRTTQILEENTQS